MHRYSYPIQNFTINISFITGSLSPSMHFSQFTNIHVSNLTILEIHMIYWRWILADFDYSNATKVCSLCGTQEWKITTTKYDVVFEVHRATITTDWSATILKLVLKLVLQADSHHFGDEHVTYSYDLDCEKQEHWNCARILRSVSRFDEITHCEATGHFSFTFDPAST